MTALLTGDWIPVGKNEYFRKFEVYTMSWYKDVDLDNLLLTTAQFGGPIIVTRDRNAYSRVHGAGKPSVFVYTASGKPISSFVWNSGTVIQSGWSSTSDMLFIQDDGYVLIYDLFSTFIHKFDMGKEAQETKVIQAKTFKSESGTGVAVLTTAKRFFLVDNLKEVRVRKLGECPMVNVAPVAWVVVHQDSRNKIICACEKDIFVLKEHSVEKLKRIEFDDEKYTIVDMALSCDLSNLAVMTSTGKLWFGSDDLTKTTRIFSTENEAMGRPLQLAWCGNDGVVINWGRDVEVVTPFEDSFTYNYSVKVFVVQELDGVRVISSLSHDIIQKVPEVVKEIFRINSTSEGSYLMEALKQFQKKSYRSNEYLHLVKPKLAQAVDQCIEAAGYDFNTDTQKLLIKAAQFGKTFLQDYDPHLYVYMCSILRCLNAIRHPKVGIPLSYLQLQSLTIEGLLDLLVQRRHHYLALEIATFLKLRDSSRILSDWACYKVKESTLPKDQIAHEIAEKLGRAKGVSYSEIAEKAANYGRKDLAIKLIDYEPRADLQIPLLLSLGEERAALAKAIDSGNTDLVYTVLLQMKDKIPLAQFQMEVRDFPLAQTLYLKYCMKYDPEGLKRIYNQEDAHSSLAECSIRECFSNKEGGMREGLLVAAQECYKKAKNDINAQLCDEQQKLWKIQVEMENKLKREFVDLSLHDTIKQLLNMQEIKLADKLKSDFKVPDKRYWWLRIEVLASLEEWAELEKFSKSKKSPIGYEPFFDACWEKNQPQEAAKYLPRIKDDFKVKYLVILGKLEEAARTAYEQKDIEALKYVETKCDPEFANEVATMIRQLSKK